MEEKDFEKRKPKEEKKEAKPVAKKVDTSSIITEHAFKKGSEVMLGDIPCKVKEAGGRFITLERLDIR